MKLVLNYESIDGDYYFDILESNKKVGELSIETYDDSYQVKAEAYSNFYTVKNKSIVQKVEEIFMLLDKQRELLDLFDRPILLVEDESIINLYAVQHNLLRVPRWYGYFY